MADWRNPEIPRSLAYMAARGGIGTGLPAQGTALLTRLGYAERYPYRAGASIHQGVRLTREGFRAAGKPWRAGWVGLAYGGKAVPGLIPGWTLTLSCPGPEGLRLALVPMPGRSTFPGAPPPTAPAEISVHADVGEALEALRESDERARSLAGLPGALAGPAFLAWDGAAAWFEDDWQRGGEPLGAEEILDRLASAFPAPGSPRP